MQARFEPFYVGKFVTNWSEGNFYIFFCDNLPHMKTQIMKIWIIGTLNIARCETLLFIIWIQSSYNFTIHAEHIRVTVTVWTEIQIVVCLSFDDWDYVFFSLVSPSEYWAGSCNWWWIPPSKSLPTHLSLLFSHLICYL
jgi:hypothetical protein